MKIYYSHKFIKAYKKIPYEIKLIAEKKEELFRLNPFDPQLKTHKLKGELFDYYSFSISYHWRIVFHFENDNKIVVFDIIGTHQVYK